MSSNSSSHSTQTKTAKELLQETRPKALGSVSPLKFIAILLHSILSWIIIGLFVIGLYRFYEWLVT